MNRGILRKTATVVSLFAAVASGWAIGHFGYWGDQRPAAENSGPKVLYYQSPMHPWVTSDHPGKCTVCGMKLVPVYAGDSPRKRVSNDAVLLPPESIHAIGIETATVRRQPLVRTLRISGTFSEEETRHGVISATVDGRIEGLAMSCEGQQVRRHQPLVTLFSQTLIAAADAYRASLKAGGPELELARRRLVQYGLADEQIESIPQRQADDRYFGILAPLTGTITKSYVAEGQYVKQGERLFEIADFTRMWYLFTAYEQDIPLLKAGQFVTLEVPSLGGQTVHARIAFISPNLDEATRSATVRVVVENHDGKIRNKTSAPGTVELSAEETLTVPRGAVLWTGSHPRAYVETDEGVYESRLIELGRSGDVAWEIVGGLKEGDRVVVNGNLLIDAQAQLRQVTMNP